MGFENRFICTKLYNYYNEIWRSLKYKESNTLSMKFSNKRSCLNKYSSKKPSSLTFICLSRLLEYVRVKDSGLGLFYFSFIFLFWT